jgi:hypothetical protein
MGFLERLFRRRPMLAGWKRAGRRKARHLDGYSVEIQNGVRECVSVLYREANSFIVFDGEKVGPKWMQLNLFAPKQEPESRIAAILPRVAEGLESLGREFVIYKSGDPMIVADSERADAANDLRSMGLDPEVSADGKTVKLKKLPGDYPKPGQRDPKKEALRMMRNMQALAGKRFSPVVLAKSRSAIV